METFNEAEVFAHSNHGLDDKAVNWTPIWNGTVPTGIALVAGKKYPTELLSNIIIDQSSWK